MKTRSVDNRYLFCVLPILTLSGLVLLFFGKMAFSNLILARGDIFLYFYPYWHAAAAALRAGRVPFWNPNIFMGAPLIANSQAGFFYPFNWLVWWILDTPYAVSASIILHLVIGGMGTFFAGRKVMGLGRSASLLAAVAFALGGYLTAQVEHINQLQGLSWLPWFLVAVDAGDFRNARSRLGSILAVAILFSLQLLAGHTQTTFITGIGLILWIFARILERRTLRINMSETGSNNFGTAFAPLLTLTVGVLLAVVVTAVQLLPTLELTRLSSRQGGLPVSEVLSFSLPPLLLSRSMLPALGQSIFSEYAAFLPLIVLALAFVGAWQWRRSRGVLPALVWVVIGLWLALGVYNPLYWLLAKLPGFDLFRAPARWMALYALGVALLAGVGWQLILRHVQVVHKSSGLADGQNGDERPITRPLRLFLIISLALFVWGFAARYFTELIPTGPEAPYEAPSLATFILWVVEWLILAAMLLLLSSKQWASWKRWIPGLLIVIAVAVLYIGSRAMPYNQLTTPEAYFDIRSAIGRLLAENDNVPARFLSLSDIFFESGDQDEINSVYADQLPAAAQYDYTIAIKQKEIIAPNLPMTYGLSSVDGFDGGILPLQSFSQLTKLLLPEGTMTSDGRLREQLNDIPEARWLDLFNTRFLITDKVGDLWRDGVFFDRQHSVELNDGEVINVGYLPDYEATQLQILAPHQPGFVSVETKEGDVWDLVPEQIDEGLFLVSFPSPATLAKLQVSSCAAEEQCVLEAMTLVDERDGTFQAILPGEYRLIHSGDVKIYENLDVMPRAFIVHNWQWAPDLGTAVDLMNSPDFDVRDSAVLINLESVPSPPDLQDSSVASGQVEIEFYSPERVALDSAGDQDGLLVLTDSYYPGWTAFVDGQQVPIIQADGLFRGVFVPAGRHEVVFELDPQSYNYGRLLSLVGLATMAILIIIMNVMLRAKEA